MFSKHESTELIQASAELKRLTKLLQSRTNAAIRDHDRYSPMPERRRPTAPSWYSNQTNQTADYGHPNSQKSHCDVYRSRREYTRHYERGKQLSQRNVGSVPTCTRCGYSAHSRGIQFCPAMRNGRKCGKCKRTGHFSSQCFSAKNSE